MRRSSGPTQSGWRLAERWSMPGGQGAHGGHPVVDLLAEQQAAAARLGPLADHDLHRVGLAEVGGVEAVARRQDLVDEQRRGLALLGGHARRRRWWCEVPTSVAARPRASLAEAERAPKLMPAMVMGMSSSSGLAPWRPPSTVRGVAALAVALERVARHRRGEEDEIVEGRELAPGAEPADGVVAGVGHLVDAGDDLGREGVVGTAGRIRAGAAISRRCGCGWRSGRAGGPRPPW